MCQANATFVDATPQGLTMPILPREPDHFPVEMFNGADVGGSRVWWVLHSKPRQEKSLARRLWSARVPFYLPTIERRCRVRGRIVTARVPLFAGYLFLNGTPDERLTALTTNRVVRTLPVEDQDRLWGDLRQIQRLIASGAAITPEDRLGPGSPVEVASGPLAGLRGTIMRTASGRRFVVQVDFIQRGASVVLDDCVLIPTAALVPA